MREAHIVSVGTSPIGRTELTNRDLFTHAMQAAFNVLSTSPAAIVDALFVGNQSMRFENQILYGTLLAEWCGLTGIHAERVEACSASGGIAVKRAVEAVRNGSHDVVIAAGVENMSGDDSDTVTDAVIAGTDRVLDQRAGLTGPAMYALMARRYLHETDNDEADLAKIAVKNHRNALANPRAQYHKKIELADVIESAYVAPPLKLFDCAPVSDGGAVVVVADAETAATLAPATDRVTVTGVASHSNTVGIAKHNLTALPSARQAIEAAYEEGGVKSTEIDVAEVHDAFTINEALTAEAAGFVEAGNGPEVALPPAERSPTSTAVQTSTGGGLKARGHPIGATGVLQIIDAYEQLTGAVSDAGQISNAEVALTVSQGGTADSMTVAHVLEGAADD